MDWITIVAVMAFGGLLVYGLWCASNVIKGAVDDVWRTLGW